MSSLPHERSAQLRYQYVEFLVDHLCDCCRVFQGDLQEMLVLALIGQIHMRAMLDAGPDGMIAPRTIPGIHGISASRVAEITGIPRQTVRRKLAKLEAKGWVETLPSGLWALVTRDGSAAARLGEDGLNALDARSMARVLGLAKRLGRIIAGTNLST